MMEKTPENIDMEIVNAHAVLMNMMHAIQQIGATDNNKKEVIESIMKRLLDKTISSQDALKEAENILKSK